MRRLGEEEENWGEDTSSSWSFSFPGWEQKAVDDSRLPDVVVAGGGELPRVAGKNPGVMRQVVVQTEVCTLRIHERQTITDDRVATEGLLHAEDGFEAADEAVIDRRRPLEAVVGLDPVALRVVAASELRAQTEAGILRLPPDVRAIEVLLCALQQSVVGEPDL